MFHLVARALEGRLLFRTDTEALALWRAIVRAFPELTALCLMPDHVHLILPHGDPSGRLSRLKSGWTRWLNARGRPGRLWRTGTPPQPIQDTLHLRRTIRYVHLNPCRAGLVDDPLSWPFSTHRDAVGLAVPAVVGAHPHPERFHRFVSADGTVRPTGTPLPAVRYDPFTWEEVVEAACALTRSLPSAITERAPARPLAVRAAWVHGLRDSAELARRTGLTRRRVQGLVRGLPTRGGLLDDVALEACVRTVGDPRFVALGWGEHRNRPSWWRYRRCA